MYVGAASVLLWLVARVIDRQFFTSMSRIVCPQHDCIISVASCKLASGHAQLGGGITEKKQGGFFSEAQSMPQIIEAINKAAYDPRVSGIYLKLSRLDVGWGKVQVCCLRMLLFLEFPGAAKRVTSCST